MQLHECLPHLLHEFKHESDLLKAVQELSSKFTVKREDISDYLKDERLVSAYTAFYLTTNFPKLKEILKWMPQAWLDLLKNCPMVDVGSGPGTFGLAWKDWAIHSKQTIYQIETSAIMRQQARKLWDGLYPAGGMSHLQGMKEIPESVAIFGHSANEMGPYAVMDYIEKINPDHILFIEPGTKDFFPKMLQIRQQLLDKKFNLIFPCPKESACPMAGSDKDWCHQFIHVSQSPDVERLSQILKMDRKLLPLTVHAYSKTFKHADSERIVRVHPATKFSYEMEVCVGEKVEHYQVFRRGLSKRNQKIIEETLAGASIESKTVKEVGTIKRVELLKINDLDFES